MCRLDEGAHLFVNRDVLDAMVLALLERETLDKGEIQEVFASLQLREPRPAWTGSTRRRPDDRGPVLTASELASRNGNAMHAIDGSSGAPDATPGGSGTA